MPTIRRPAVAGRFYPDSRQALSAQLAALFPSFALSDKPCAVMVPHAGYIYSGSVAAAALAGVAMPETCVILCPSHTGLGHPLGVWPDGAWETPLGSVPVNAQLAEKLIAQGLYAADTRCHAREHSIEVVLPFLQHHYGDKVPSIVPVCVGTMDPRALEIAGVLLARAAGEGIRNGTIGLIVSSDMNHYESEQVTRAKDERALDCVTAQDPALLLDRCRRERITMCGCAPMALTLHCLNTLRQGQPPAKPARIVAHSTSGQASGDFEHVVGYAGVRLYL